MEDRLFRGFVAGTVGGIISSALSHLLYYWELTTLRMSDWAAILLFAHAPPFSVGEHIFSVLIHIGYSGAVGSVFAYFVSWVTSRMIVFKGWVIGSASWFILYVLTALFEVEGTVPVPLSTALSDYIAAAFYGIVMGYCFDALDLQHARTKNPLELLAQPAAKPGEDKTKHSDEDD